MAINREQRRIWEFERVKSNGGHDWSQAEDMGGELPFLALVGGVA
ncbi:hypothetical protein CASFOL_012528 [Castilleja foliolosa]|uniref:Uncharacterized protein n=1 Tax=Castilleja foliolosa TaxID=1961234 RepID=A0ABD3DHC1_9LAMI